MPRSHSTAVGFVLAVTAPAALRPPSSGSHARPSSQTPSFAWRVAKESVAPPASLVRSAQDGGNERWKGDRPVLNSP